MDVNQIILAIGAICSAIILVGGAIAVVGKWVKPLSTMKDDICKLKESDENTKEGIGVICRCLLALMECYGDKPEIKLARKEMQDYLTKI